MAFKQPFRDRRDAGRALARRLTERLSAEPGDVVVAVLPRGGIPVGYEVAGALRVPMDIVLVRKLGVPSQPELGMGALGEDGTTVLDHELIGRLGISDEEVAEIRRVEAEEIDRQRALYRRDIDPIPVAGKTVILVDDGAATGVSASAAGRVLRESGVERLIGAFPVAAPGIEQRLGPVFAEVLCLEEPVDFRGVGGSYEDFAQTGDDEVLALLRTSRNL